MDAYRTQLHVTYEAASEALAAGLAKAVEIGIKVGIVITDATGEIVAVARMDGANQKAWKGALGKATVAGSMGRTTEDFLENRLKGDEVLWRALSANPDTMLVPGGSPLLVGGRSVGGVGVSGGRYDDDARVAAAAAKRFDELVAEAESSSNA